MYVISPESSPLSSLRASRAPHSSFRYSHQPPLERRSNVRLWSPKFSGIRCVAVPEGAPRYRAWGVVPDKSLGRAHRSEPALAIGAAVLRKDDLVPQYAGGRPDDPAACCTHVSALVLP